MRLLGSRDPNLVVTTADPPDGIGLPLQEATWRPEGVFDLREWPWVVEKAILDSNATVALVRADEPSLRSGQLNAEGYLAVLQELADRLPGVTWVCSTVSMDEPDELLERFNRRVREHVLQTQGALLDTSDIESWHAGEHALKDDAPGAPPGLPPGAGHGQRGEPAPPGRCHVVAAGPHERLGSERTVSPTLEDLFREHGIEGARKEFEQQKPSGISRSIPDAESPSPGRDAGQN